MLKEKIKLMKLDLTEEEVLKSIKRVISLIAKKSVFPGYSEDDISQESYIIALKQLDKFDVAKASSKGGEGLIQKLENFLYFILSKRLINLKRDKFSRNDPPCRKCYLGALCTNGKACTKFLIWKERNDVKMSSQNPWSLSTNDDDRFTDDLEDPYYLPCPNSEKLFDGIDVGDAVQLIRSKLSPELLDSFNTLYEGGKVGYAKKALLLEEIHEILGTS